MVKKVISAGAIAVLAAGAVAVGRWLGGRPDGPIEQLLASPSAVERWTSELAGRQTEQGKESKPPLVVQAEALAAYLNPPVPPKRVASPVPARPRPAPVEAKLVTAAAPSLRLIGISYHCSNPAESRALLWESADGQRWVRPGMQVGHVVIERINPGSILCRDAEGTREVVMGSESAPSVPVQNTPASLPAGGSDDRALAVAPGSTSPNRAEKVEPVKPDAIGPLAPQAVAMQVEAPKKEIQPSRSSPGHRPRPVRSVAKKG